MGQRFLPSEAILLSPVRRFRVIVANRIFRKKPFCLSYPLRFYLCPLSSYSIVFSYFIYRLHLCCNFDVLHRSAIAEVPFLILFFFGLFMFVWIVFLMSFVSSMLCCYRRDLLQEEFWIWPKALSKWSILSVVLSLSIAFYLFIYFLWNIKLGSRSLKGIIIYLIFILESISSRYLLLRFFFF